MAQRSRFNFAVTPEDIKKARINDGEGNSFRCMVMQTIARQLPDAHHIDVDLQTVRWSDELGRHVFLTPYEVAGYIVAFDAGEEIHPFSFQLRNAVPAMQKKALTRGAKGTKKVHRKVRTEKERLAAAEKVVADPASPPERIAAAREVIEQAPVRIKQAEQNRDDVKAAYQAAGETSTEHRVSEATRKAPPRVFKTKQRAYGQRVLRVNQGPDRIHYAG